MPTHVKLGDINIPRKESVTKTDSRRNRKSEQFNNYSRIESIFQFLFSHIENTGHNNYIGQFDQTFKEQIITILHKLSELKKERLLLFILVVSYNLSQRGKNGPISFVPRNAKNFKEIMLAVGQNDHKMKLTPRIQDWFNLIKYINIIYHIKGFKEKTNVYMHR